MKLSSIMIPPHFMAHPPAQWKKGKCLAYYDKHKKLDRELVIDHSGVLQDGYVGYIVLMENGIAEYDVRIVNHYTKPKRRFEPYKNRPTTYIVGRHGNNPNEYVWRITNHTKQKESIIPGSHVLVQTRNGNKVVTVVNVLTQDHPPVPGVVKKVLRCLIS